MNGRTRVILTLTACMAFSLATFAVPGTHAQEPDAEFETMSNVLGLMDQYLEVSSRWLQVVSQRESLILLAAEGIIEIYEAQGDKAKAIPHLRRVMEQYRQDPIVRNAIRFKIRDIYKERGMYEEALRELEAVIAENTK